MYRFRTNNKRNTVEKAVRKTNPIQWIIPDMNE